MSRVGIAFLALIVTSSTALAQAPLLLCKIHSRGLIDRPLVPHPNGGYMSITDWGHAIHLASGGGDMVLPVVRRGAGPWLLTAQLIDQGSTTVIVGNLPEYDGLTLHLEMQGKAPGGIVLRGSCKPN